MIIGLGLTLRATLFGSAFSPSAIFAASEPGIWLDPSDLTTMFQDADGTIPVTAPGQSVRLRLDKSGNDNHALATSDTTRCIYGVEPFGGRRNILIDTAELATQSRTVTAVEHTLSFRGTGTVTLTGASIAGPLVGAGVDDIVSLTFIPTAGSLTLTVLGTVNDAQLEIGDARSGYQLVGASTFNITEAGVPTVHYVQYDGVDDFYVTPTITPGTDKVQVFAGVRKLSDAAAAALVEHGASPFTNNGTFSWLTPHAGVATVAFYSRGTALQGTATPPNYASPISLVLTGIGDISGDRATFRIDGTQVAQSTGDQGTGNYLTYPLYIGRRGGTSLPFNGRDYGIIVRFGDNLDTSTITATETWLAAKTGVTL